MKKLLVMLLLLLYTSYVGVTSFNTYKGLKNIKKRFK